MKRTTKWVLAATACLTLSVAQLAAQDAQTTTNQDEKKTEAQHQRHMKGKMGRMGGKAHMDRMAKELGLTDAQQTQLKSIHEQQRTKVQELRNNDSLTREQKMEQLKALRESTQSQVNNVLTADQQKKFSEIKAHHKERVGKHRKGRRGDWGEKHGDAPKQDSTQK
jgi:Spy/CpxP family protein refolding chaperone